MSEVYRITWYDRSDRELLPHSPASALVGQSFCPAIPVLSPTWMDALADSF
ncbi:hypothetical protein ACN4EK_15535 [Pantanalinema rosaneae CENA516]|uniref:hypothetical protein n=1 Tax=Pantanalinema rosaneae TaxID=1620701 RepID=UPI003D6E4292